MGNVRRIYVEKKAPFAVKAKELKGDLKNYLNLKTIEDVRIFIRYDVEHISDEVFERACRTVFSEPPVDELYREEIAVPENGRVFLFFSKEINPRFYRGNKNALVKKNRASKGKPEKGVEEKKTSK